MVVKLVVILQEGGCCSESHHLIDLWKTHLYFFFFFRCRELLLLLTLRFIVLLLWLVVYYQHLGPQVFYTRPTWRWCTSSQRCWRWPGRSLLAVKSAGLHASYFWSSLSPVKQSGKFVCLSTHCVVIAYKWQNISPSFSVLWCSWG